MVMLFGRVGKDAEIRNLSSGELMGSFSIATSEKWKDRNTGEAKERTEWHNVVVFGNQVETVEKFARKGRRLIVRGPLRTRKWQAQDGTDRYSTEIVISGYNGNIDVVDFEDRPKSGGAAGRDAGYSDVRGRGQERGQGGGDEQGQSSSGYGGYGGGSGGGRNDMDDEIPF